MDCFLRDVPAWDLDKFHHDHLQPNEEFLTRAGRDIHCICEFLKTTCFQDPSWKVQKVVKGGSLGKGTSMKNGSDVDLVVFLNVIKSFTVQENLRKVIITEIERRLKECQGLLSLNISFKTSNWPNPRVLQFKLYSYESTDSIEFDVLPAYDAIGHFTGKPNPLIYVDLINEGKHGEFSPCFTELQRDFILDRPPKLKSLIRLVKHWYKEVLEKPFPPKYALELLTVYAWEQGSREQKKFDTAEGFRTVLWLIENYKKIRIYWTKYYDFDDNEKIKQYLQRQLSKNRPVILDPADPTVNFGEAEGWDRLAEKAKRYAGMRCCHKHRDGSWVQPWDVQTDSAQCRMFEPNQLHTDSASPPSKGNSAQCQMFKPNQLHTDSAFHPPKLAKEVPQEEGWCALL